MDMSDDKESYERYQKGENDKKIVNDDIEVLKLRYDERDQIGEIKEDDLE